jgi:hypothetical protein
MPLKIFKTPPAFIDNKSIWIVRLQMKLVCDHASFSRSLRRRLGERFHDPRASAPAHTKAPDDSQWTMAVSDLGFERGDNPAYFI